MIKIVIAILMVICALGVAAWAQQGGTQSPFSLGAGARDLALGGADLAFPDAATAVYWNPAALARAEQVSLGAFHCRLYEPGVVYQYLGGAVPTMDLGGFGAGILRLGVSDIERRDANNLSLGEFDDSRLGMYFGYGRSVASYDLGAALTLEHQSLDSYSTTSSPGLNLAVSRRFRLGLGWMPQISAGLCGRNMVRPRIKLADQAVKLPSSLEAGISAEILPHPAWNQKLSLSAKITKVDMLHPRVAAGLEYSLQQMLHLRAGINHGGLSFGVGLAYRMISFDYALVDRDLGSLHTFSISSTLGMPMSQKRQVREAAREAEFNQLITSRLAGQNREMVSDLVARGKDLMQQGALEEASLALDRAVFLAWGGGQDTSDIYLAALEASRQIDETIRKRAFEAHMDSAWSKLSAGDYLGARYSAGLALEKFPESRAAQDLMEEIDLRVQQSANNQLLIESRLLLADSLISYGRFEEALAVARALEQIAGEDGRVTLVRKKAEFGSWSEVAELAFSRADYATARAAADSALSRFPNHPWGTRIISLIEQERIRSEIEPVRIPEEKPPSLSEDLLKEVDQTYRTGQRLFQEGNLQSAISQWERVEALAPNYKSVRQYLVNAYKFVGVQLYTQNRLEAAVEVWKKAARLDPDRTEISNYIRRTEREIARLREISYDHR
jgi:tetratricopeptide (TPR) repeat protein